MRIKFTHTIYLLQWLLAALLPMTFYGQISSSPAIVNDSILLCAQADSLLSISTSSANGPFVWTFNGGTPGTAIGAGPHQVLFTSPGNYQITLSAPSDPSLDGRTIHVIVGSQPTVAFQPSDTLFCTSDSPFTLDGSSPGGGYYSGPGVVGNTFDPAVAGTGTHKISYHYSSGSCEDSASVNFTVMSVPNAHLAAQGTPITFNGQLTYSRCVPASSVFNFYTQTPSSQYTSYSLDFGDGTPAQTGTVFPTPAVSHSYGSIGIYKVVLTLYGANGCPAHDTVTIFYGSNPSVGLSITGNNIKCLPRDSSGIVFWFPITNYKNNPPGTIYVIEVNDGSAPQTFSHPPPDSIMHIFYEPSCGYNTANFNDAFQVKITAQTPCVPHSVATVEPILISDPPTAEFTVQPRVCIGNPVLVQDQSWGSQNALTGCDTNVTLVWEISPSTFSVNSGYMGSMNGDPNPANWFAGTQDLEVIFQKTGYYTIRQYVGNQAGCEVDTMERIICVDSIPNPDFGLTPDTLCAPDTVEAFYLHNLITFCDTTSLEWSISPSTGHQLLTGVNDSTLRAYFYATGDYTISVTSYNHCDTSTFSRIVRVQNVPTLQMGNDMNYCGVQLIDFSDAGLAPQKYDSLAPLSYNWVVKPSIGWSFVNGTSANSEFPQIDFNSTGTYTIVHTITNNCGMASDSLQLSFWDIPAIDSISDTLICYDSDFGYKATLSGGNSPYQWRWYENNNLVSNSDSVFIPNITSTRQLTAVVTDSMGCGDSLSFEVTPTPELLVDAGNMQRVCYTDTAQLNASFSGGIAPFTIHWSPASVLSDSTILNPFRTPVDSSIVFTLTVTDSLGCSKSDTVSINVYNLITLDAGPDFTLCYDSIQYPLNMASHNGGIWVGPGVSSGQFSPISAGIGSHLIHYFYTDAAGCDYVDSLTINVIDIPVADFSLSNNSGCTPFEFTAYDSSSIGVNHRWYLNGNLISTIASPTFQLYNNSNTSDSTVNVKLVIEAASGCTDSITKPVTVFPKPQSNFSLPPSVCATDSITPTQNSIGKGSLDYSWFSLQSSVSISNDTIVTPQITFPDNQSGSDSTYTIGLVVFSADGCSDTSIQSILIHSRPTASFNLPMGLCSPVSISPIDSSIGNSLVYSWSVSPSISIGNAASSNPTFHFPQTSTDSAVYSISLIVSDANGCIDSTTTNYVVYPIPTAAFTPSVNDSCGPLTVAFQNNSSSNLLNQSLRDLSIEWDFGDGQSSTDSIPVHTFINNGINDTSYVVTLKVANNYGCTDSISDTIIVHPDPRADLTVNYNSACPTFTIDTSVVQAVEYPFANSEYIWLIQDLQGNLLNSDTGLSNLNFTISQSSDSIQLMLIAVSPFGCKSDTASQLFYTLPTPTANFSAVVDSGCSPLLVNLLDSSLNATSYSWYVNGSLFSSGSPGSIALKNSSNSTDSVYTIKLIVTSSNGCQDSISRNIKVFPRPFAAFGIAANSCPDDSLSVVNNSIGKGPLSYNWSANSSAVYIDNDTSASPTFYFPDNQSGSDTVYQISLMVTSADGCTDTTVNDVRIFSRPIADFQLPVAQCGPYSIQPTDVSTGNALNYSWSINPFANGSGLNTQTPVFDLNVSTNDSVVYTINLMVTDGNGCTDSISRTQVVYPKPTADFTLALKDSCGPFTVNFTNLSSPNQSGLSQADMNFNWDFGNGQSSTLPNPSVTYINQPIKDTVYVVRLIATNPFGCSDTISDSVTVHPDPIAAITLSDSLSCAPFLIDSSVVNVIHYPIANSSYNWEILDLNGSLLAQGNGRNTLNYSILNAQDSVLLRLIATSAYGCKSDTLEQLFYTIENPVARFGILPTQGCSPLSVSIFDSSTVGVTHNWYINQQLVSNQASPVFNFINNSSITDSVITIKLVVEAGTGCKDSTERQLTIYPQPVADFTISATSCPVDTLTPTNTSMGKGSLTYVWSVSSPSVIISDSSIAEPDFVFADNQSGFDSTYTIQLIVFTTGGCSDTSSQQISISSRPLADFTLTNSSCGPSTIIPTDLSSGNHLMYNWKSQPTIVISQPTSPSPQLNFPVSTNDSIRYTITLLLTDSITACVDSISRKYVVYPKPTAAFTLSQTDSCSPFSPSIVNLSSPNQSGMTRADMTFDWLFSDGTTSSDSLPSISFSNSGQRDTTFAISLIATNAFGCSDTITDSVTVHPDPIMDFSLRSPADCAPFTIDSSLITHTHYASANSGYNWRIIDYKSGNILSSTVNLSTLNHSMSKPGDSVLIQGIALSSYGCQADTLQYLFYTIGRAFPGFEADVYQGCSPLTVNFTDTVPGFSGWYWLVNGVQRSTIQNPSLTFTNSSTSVDSVYEVKMIAVSGAGCTDTVTQFITVFGGVEAQFVASNDCDGSSISFTNTTVSADSISSWLWSFGDGNSDTLQHPMHNYGQEGKYYVSLTATSVNGCSHTFSDSVTVYPLPLADFFASSACGSDTICSNQSVQFSDSSTLSTLGGSITQWLWDMNGDGVDDYNVQNPAHTFTTTGSHQVRLIVISQYGCRNTVYKDVLAIEPPQAHFNIDSMADCGPFTTSVTDSAFGIIESYLWEVYVLSPSGNKTVLQTSSLSQPASLPTFYPNYGSDTTYYISQTVSNCCGSSTFTDSIVLKSLPIAKMLPSVNIGCTPLNVTFQLDGQVSGRPDFLVMNYGDGQIDTLYRFYQIGPSGDTTWVWGQQQHTFVNPHQQDTTFTVSLLASNSCGDSTVTTNITVHPNNVQAFIQASPQSGCAPLAVTFVDKSFGGNSTSWCFDYNTTTGQCNQPSAIGDSIIYTYNSPGTYTVAQFVSDGCSSDTAFVTITVSPSPTAAFTSVPGGCEGDVISFTDQSSNTGSGITGYSWNFGDGSSSFLQNPIHQYAAPGTYNVCLVISTTNGCMDSICRSVTVFDKPEMEFSAANACLNQQPIEFFDSSSVQQGQIISTLWKFGDGNTSVNANPRHTYSAPGSYTVTLIHSSTYGCMDSIQKTINVFPTSTANFGINRSFGKNCGAPQNFSFTNLSASAAGYYWDFDYQGNRGQNTSTLVNPSFTFLNEGVYKVLLVATNPNGCSDSIIKTVSIRPFPKAGFEGDNFQGCAPLTVNFSDTSVYNFPTGGIDSWVWDFGDGTQDSGSSAMTHTYTVPGTYSVSLKITNDGGCTDTVQIGNYIKVLATPIAGFKADKQDAKTYTFNNTTQYRNGSTTFEWDFGDGHTSSETSPTHRYNVNLLETDHSFEVCLYTKNAEGCGDTICTPLKLEGYELYTPNAFAPDLAGAGAANYFLPAGHSMKTYHLTIFDEWGNIIFESTSLDENGIPNEPWNGKHLGSGAELPMGAYVWKIDAVFTDGTIWEGKQYGNQRKNYGTVTLIR